LGWLPYQHSQVTTLPIKRKLRSRETNSTASSPRTQGVASVRCLLGRKFGYSLQFSIKLFRAGNHAVELRIIYLRWLWNPHSPPPAVRTPLRGGERPYWVCGRTVCFASPGWYPE
jgi:hypothetical protein